MTKKGSNNFFTQNGKRLKKLVNTGIKGFQIPEQNIYPIENISSLAFVKETTPITENDLTFKKVLNYKFQRARKWFKSKATSTTTVKKIWLTGSVASFVLIALTFIVYPMKIVPALTHKYSIYASTPLQFGSTTYQIYSRDARSQKINMVFRKFNCPLEGLGEVFVYEADKHNIPWWLVAAVSFQESSCGKLTPEPDGVESYNAWGWAVYGDNVQTFDNWARGIETVSEYMSKKFFSKGITEPCDIMKTYTPPSKGSWCEGVKYFGDLIQNYSSENI